MADYSGMSDANLLAIVKSKQDAAPADYSKMSDADLMAAVKPQAPQRGVVDKLFGVTGERYQTWPERAARGVVSGISSGATLPGDVMAGKASPDDTGRVMDLAAMGIPVNPAIRAGDKIIPGAVKAIAEKKPVVPSTQELQAAGGADIQAAQSSDLKIPAQAVADYSRKVQQGLMGPGSSIHPVDAPNTFTKLKELEGAPSDAFFTPSNLQSLRESLQATAQNFNPNAAKDQLAASRAIKQLDQLLSSVGPKDTVARPTASQGLATKEQLIADALSGKREADRVSGLFERGRGNYAAAMRSNDISGELDRARTGVLERAEGRAQAANSGRNIDNTIRQKAEALLEKPKEISGFSNPEVASLEHVVEGGAGRNTARNVGNWLGSGGGIGQTGMATLGGVVGNAVMPGPIGIALGASLPTSIGAGAKAIANALAKRDLRAVDELMRKRSPLYEERAANPEKYVISPEKRAALARALLMNEMGSHNQ